VTVITYLAVVTFGGDQGPAKNGGAFFLPHYRTDFAVYANRPAI
jgi:hypothetical protein